MATKDLLTILKTLLKTDTVEQGKKDITVKSKDREAAKKTVEVHFKKIKLAYKSVFKASKSSSLEVLEVNGFGDIIFKPIIQKGAGGVGFEKELKVDLENFFNGADIKQLKHADVLAEMKKVMKIDQKKKYTILHEGSKNQKRSLAWDGKKLSVSNSTGETLTDITLQPPKGSPIYLSLKMSKSYYILSGAIAQYFKDKTTNSALCEYLGLDGSKMGGFGKEFFCVTGPANYTKAKNNIEKFLANAYGSNVTIIHKKIANDVMVSQVGTTNTVKISNLTEASYLYPEKNVRKYANIKFNAVINNHNYIVNFQFRGTTAADVGPKYLRILMERV